MSKKKKKKRYLAVDVKYPFVLFSFNGKSHDYLSSQQGILIISEISSTENLKGKKKKSKQTNQKIKKNTNVVFIPTLVNRILHHMEFILDWAAYKD